MPQLSSTNICTVQAKEAQHTGSGILKTGLSVEVGSERGYRSVQRICTDDCAVRAPKPCLEVPLSDGVCIPQYQPGRQLLGTTSSTLVAAGLQYTRWHKPLRASLYPSTLRQTHVKHGMAGARESDPV